ncbi:DUF5004 domain-containing protein [Allomuricauda sp. CP2A]|jgi:hypothetical protein|uniref:DUF5004 domain-containing protein n=1 Tax=Allomuricauda sp. CP2A TaxID=1848189 RepID=UPI0008348C60|nr:DUF5004 domain-containing protein [Muricauda sp. CP2A]
MKRVIFSIVGLFVMSGLVLSCSSDDGADCPEDFSGALEANEEKLVGQWQLTAILADEAVDITDDDTENPSTNLFAQYNECQKDGVYTFNADRSYIFEQGQNGTNCQNKGTFEGTWQLSSNILGLIFSCNTQNLVVTFNGSDTAFSFSDDFNITDVSGNTIEANITFTYSLVE